MKEMLNLIPPGYNKQTLTKKFVIKFLDEINSLYEKLQDNSNTTEEFHKNNISTFLQNHTLSGRFFQEDHPTNYDCNVYNKIDLALYHGTEKNKKPYVIVETKDPHKSSDMISKDDFNKKSLAQLIHYFYQEEENNNYLVKNLIITNGIEWFIFDAQDFKKATENFKKIHKQFSERLFTDNNVDFFYNRVKDAESSFFENLQELVYYFNLNDYTDLNIENEDDIEKVIILYRFFSPYTLLKEAHTTDANSLDQKFYKNLLYILGLEEKNTKEITNKIEESSTPHTLIKLICKVNPSLQNLDEKIRYLLLIINRILFLKLLEASLITIHPKDSSYHFLNKDIIQDFSRLKELFFQVLAKKERASITPEFIKIPYLNSSLFDLQDDENFLYDISVHDKMPDKNNTQVSVLHYLLDFLNSYDFGSCDNIIQEEAKPLINSAVLGLVFEKLNGYQEGAHFTPEAITHYMSTTSVKESIINLFRRELDRDITSWEDLKEITQNDKSLVSTFNKIRICDPAVGSGHFVVSVLNKLIEFKHELGLFCYKDERKVARNEYTILVENDELLILDDNNKIFTYQVSNGRINAEKQKLQEAIFEEKKFLIENCLFGVDVNPKSVMICQLRLWIELLKHTYYHVTPEYKPTHLETLPNIDINIKEGNSLIHRFDIRDKRNLSLKEINFLQKYHRLITQYKEEASGDEKSEYRRKIEILKCNVQKENIENKIKVIEDLITTFEERATALLTPPIEGVPITDKNKKASKDLQNKIAILTKQKEPEQDFLTEITDNIRDLTNKTIKKARYTKDRFANSMEWRYEFPEVLNLETGEFVGFDLIIMNPPYFALQTSSQKNNFDRDSFATYASTGDIYQLFMEKSFDLIRDKGIVSTIISNKWMRSGYGKSTRAWLCQNAYTHEVLDLGSGWFDSATVDTNIICYERRDDRPYQDAIPAYTLHNKIISIDHGKLKAEQKQITPTLTGDSWIIVNPQEATILNKMNKIGKPLKDWDVTINYGIKTGYNEAFIIDGNTRSALIKEDPKSEEIIKPLLRGRDIKRYSYEFADKWVIIAKYDSHLYLESQYPAIYKHLLQYEEQLKNRGQCRYSRGGKNEGQHHWLELDNNPKDNYLEKFEKPKIVWIEICDNNQFHLDISKMYNEATSFIMTSDIINLYFLLGILNSKSIKWCLHRISAATGMGTFRWKKVWVENLPIPVPTPAQEKQITKLVQTILHKKEQNQDSSSEEQEIDTLVYTLYGLSQEEIQIVEGA